MKRFTRGKDRSRHIELAITTVGEKRKRRGGTTKLKPTSLKQTGRYLRGLRRIRTSWILQRDCRMNEGFANLSATAPNTMTPTFQVRLK